MKKGQSVSALPLCRCVADCDQRMKPPRWLLPPLLPCAWFIDWRKLLPLLLTMRLVELNCGRMFCWLFWTCTVFTGLLLIFTPLLMRIGLVCVWTTGLVSTVAPPLPTFTGMLTILPGEPLAAPLVVPALLPPFWLLVAG